MQPQSKRRLLALAAKTAIVGLVVLVLILVACLGPVDTSPWSENPVGPELKAALDSVRTHTNIVAGKLRAGFGRARLTPQSGAAANAPDRGEFKALPLAGYGQRQGRPATGVHDDLWVKATALAVGGRTGIIVSADALIIPRDVAEAAADFLRPRGIERGQLYFGATHSHSSIGGWGRGLVAEAFAGKFQPGVQTWFSRQLAAAAEGALNDLEPAETGATSFTCTNHVRNRLLGDHGSVDPEFRLVTIVQQDGDRAVIGSYSAHATVLPATVMEFSADYPGAWARAVESNNCAFAMFLAGGVGSHGPRAGGRAWEGVERMGRELAARTHKALAGLALTNTVAFGLVTVPMRLPALQARVSDKVRVRPWLAARLLPVSDQTLVQALRLGDAVWLSTPADFSGELVLDLVASHTNRLRPAVTSFNGDYVGYVIPSKYYHMSGYEPRTMSFFGPQLPDYMMAALDGLLRIVSVEECASRDAQR